MIFGAITNILGSVVKGYFETKKEKAKQKLLQVQAETKIMEKKVTGEIDWDMEMAKASDSSWKDEWLTIIFVSACTCNNFCLAFCFLVSKYPLTTSPSKPATSPKII